MTKCAAGLVFVQVSIALLFFDMESISAHVPRSCVIRAVGGTKNILIAGFPFKTQGRLSREYFPCHNFRHELNEFLGRDLFYFSGTHGNRRYVRVIRLWDAFSHKIQLQSNVNSFRASEILELHNDSGIFSTQILAVNERGGIEQNICPFPQLEGSLGHLSTFFCSIGGNRSSGSLLLNVFQGSQSNPGRNNSNNNQSPIRPERIGPRWYLARPIGLPMLLWGGWRRYRRRWNAFSFVFFLLGGCLLCGPRLPNCSH